VGGEKPGRLTKEERKEGSLQSEGKGHITSRKASSQQVIGEERTIASSTQKDGGRNLLEGESFTFLKGTKRLIGGKKVLNPC